MPAQILDGRAVARNIRQQVSDKIQQQTQQGVEQPGLAVVLVGADEASKIYVRKKRQTCEKVGIQSFNYDLPSDTPENELLELIDQLNDDPSVNGILVQLPLPDHIAADKVVDRIRADKDVDGFHPYNQGRLMLGRPLLRSCTPLGVMRLLEHYDIELEGLDVTMVGASKITGRPLAMEMLAAHSTVTVCHTATKDLRQHVQNADLLAVAIGNPNVIKSDWIKDGAIVVDIGINRKEDGSIIGDVDRDEVREKASWITPVPGGVGPMTVATLMDNTLIAQKIQRDHEAITSQYSL